MPECKVLWVIKASVSKQSCQLFISVPFVRVNYNVLPSLGKAYWDSSLPDEYGTKLFWVPTTTFIR